jgi:glutamate synthase (NADPH/NADH) small chain
MGLGEPDASGRSRATAIEGSNFVIDVDTVIVAIGTSPNPMIKVTTPEIAVTKHGCIVVDELAATSIPGVYAGGDIASGASTVIHSMGAGKLAARSIIDYIDSLQDDKCAVK